MKQGTEIVYMCYFYGNVLCFIDCRVL